MQACIQCLLIDKDFCLFTELELDSRTCSGLEYSTCRL